MELGRKLASQMGLGPGLVDASAPELVGDEGDEQQPHRTEEQTDPEYETLPPAH